MTILNRLKKLEAIAQAQQQRLNVLDEKAEIARLEELYRGMSTADLMADYNALMALPAPDKYRDIDTDTLIKNYLEAVR